MQSCRNWGQIMDATTERRISVASCWATSRMAVLDCHERYEDSYAITQEFREWITCLGDHPEQLEDSVLLVPIFSCDLSIDQASDTDELLEI